MSSKKQGKHIHITHGIDIPMSGRASGELQPLPKARQVALNLNPFEHTKFRLLVKEGSVKIGQPLVEDKGCSGRYFVSPAAGEIKEVRRGLKRRLLNIVVDVADQEEWVEHGSMDAETVSREQLIEKFKEAGLFAHIRMRPFNILANPKDTPRSIFVKAIHSAPYTPPPELHVQGKEVDFQTGLNTLAKLTSGEVHLVHSVDSTCSAFRDAKNVVTHAAEGPHPIGNHSIHIHYIDPIHSPDDVIWTLNTWDVIAIGHLMNKGHYYTDHIISVAGNALHDGRQGHFRVRRGYPIHEVMQDRNKNVPLRIISGDPLTGKQVDPEDFIEFYHDTVSVIPENTHRELLHFFRPGFGKYSAHKAYASGHLDNTEKEYEFTTSQHGEERAFIDGWIYDKVMPMRISTMHLVKSVLAEDFDEAQSLGLLEVDSEDFALPTFICPSKIEMTEIIRKGLDTFAKELLE